MLGAIALIASYFAFRTDIVFGKKLLENFSPLTVSFGTLLIAALITLIDLEQRREVKKLFSLKKRPGLMVIIIGIVSAVFIPFFFFMGLKYTSSINVVLFGSTWPIFLIIFGILFLGETVTTWALSGIAVMALGIVIIATNGFQESVTFNAGDLWTFACALLAAIYSLLFKKFSTYRQPHLIVSARALIGSIVLGPIVFYKYPHEITNLQALIPALPDFIYYAFFVVLMGYLLSFWALVRLPATTYSMIGLTGPVIGVIYAVVFLQETLSVYHVVGTACILAGLLVAKIHKHKTKTPIIHHGHPHHSV